MKRVLLVIALVAVALVGVRAAYRAARVPQLPTAPAQGAPRPDPGPLPMQAFVSATGQHYLAVYDRENHTATLLDAVGTHALAPVRTASGARYEGDGRMLWTKGGEAILEIDGTPVAGLTVSGRQALLERHWRGGVTLLASGTEPDWFLAVRPDGAEFILGGYAERHELPAAEHDWPPGLAPAGRYVFGRGDGAAVLTITPGACLDAMSGEPYAAAASLAFDGRTWTGCALGLR
ncbi:MliC family protein [bacterium]|nr:MliC family protein [bacterium]